MFSIDRKNARVLSINYFGLLKIIIDVCIFNGDPDKKLQISHVSYIFISILLVFLLVLFIIIFCNF